MKIIDRIFNAENNETVDIERDATAEEIAEVEKAQAEATARAQAIAEAEAKRAGALAKLETLGLNKDDLKALGL